MDLATLLAILALAVGTLALGVGIFHVRELRTRTKELRTLSEQIRGGTDDLRTLSEQIRGSLTTRHLGRFPEYIMEISDLVERTIKELVILCDFPAYGCFSAPEPFLEYLQALERKAAAGVSIRITCLTEESRVVLSRRQFVNEMNSWEEWLNESRGKVAAFLGSLHPPQKVESLTLDRFLNLLESKDREVLSRCDRADIALVRSEIPVFFWIADQSHAVFSIPSFKGRASEDGFHTYDSRLVNAFLEIEARYRERPPSPSSPLVAVEHT